jgi:hypothetical protein
VLVANVVQLSANLIQTTSKSPAIPLARYDCAGNGVLSAEC